jgi:hypothetical protein
LIFLINNLPEGRNSTSSEEKFQRKREEKQEKGRKRAQMEG